MEASDQLRNPFKVTNIPERRQRRRNGGALLLTLKKFLKLV